MDMNTNTPTVHNGANYGKIAPFVIMPGDPMRAKYIAEKYLKDAQCFNKVRGMLGYTGEYKGKKVSVMGSGMGIPSMGIYSYELYKFYDVKNIIRIGSCGSCSDKLELSDVVLVYKAHSNSNFAKDFSNNNSKYIEGSEELQSLVLSTAKELDINLRVCNVETSECFYSLNDIEDILRSREVTQCLAVEMETYALFNVARALEKNAATILTVTDSVIDNKKKMSAIDREKRLDDMIILALESAIRKF